MLYPDFKLHGVRSRCYENLARLHITPFDRIGLHIYCRYYSSDVYNTIKGIIDIMHKRLKGKNALLYVNAKLSNFHTTIFFYCFVILVMNKNDTKKTARFRKCHQANNDVIQKSVESKNFCLSSCRENGCSQLYVKINNFIIFNSLTLINRISDVSF